MTRKITIGLLVGAAAVLIGWDVWAVINPATDDTISEILFATAMQHPVIPFALGVVFGHLFWPQKLKG